MAVQRSPKPLMRVRFLSPLPFVMKFPPKFCPQGKITEDFFVHYKNKMNLNGDVLDHSNVCLMAILPPRFLLIQKDSYFIDTLAIE